MRDIARQRRDVAKRCFVDRRERLQCLCGNNADAGPNRPAQALHVHRDMPRPRSRHLYPEWVLPDQTPVISVPTPGLVVVEVRLIHQAHIRGAPLQAYLHDRATSDMTELVVTEFHVIPPTGSDPADPNM